MKKSSIWLVALALGLALGISMQARERGWVRLGDAHVDGGADHDNIHVGRSDGTFRAIALEVSGGAIEFQRVVVHYGNGSQEEVVVREAIPAGGRTRAIDLPGDRRVIQSVELWYSRGSWHRRPKVTLYGMK